MDPSRPAAGVQPPGRDPAALAFADAWDTLRLPMLQLATMLVDQYDLAEDIVQDAFVNLHRRWDTVDNPRAYLRVSVVNASRSALRRRRLARLHLASTVDVPVAGADAAVLVADEHRQVLRELQRLPRRQREVLVLKYFDGLSDDAIAACLSISASTVRATATRARRQLSGALEATS